MKNSKKWIVGSMVALLLVLLVAAPVMAQIEDEEPSPLPKVYIGFAAKDKDFNATYVHVHVNNCLNQGVAGFRATIRFYPGDQIMTGNTNRDGWLRIKGPKAEAAFLEIAGASEVIGQQVEGGEATLLYTTCESQ